MTIPERLGKLGIGIPQIALPESSLEYWAVIACDQFTSQPEYWEETRRIVGEHPSALNLIIPECYLNDNPDKRIAAANAKMQTYIREGLFKFLPPGFILVNRSTPHAPMRQGLVLAIDLEAYSFEKDSKSLIRTTEGIIPNRLPPRIAIRENATLELPHILLLIDDPEHTVMKVASVVADPEPLYDFDLMQEGGHVSGRFINGTGSDTNNGPGLEYLTRTFENLSARSGALLAVGDGNHSLAAAREVWNKKKQSGAPANHPARYVLAEVENIHDPGLFFHPIHRVIFHIDTAKLAEFLENSIQSSPSQNNTGKSNILLHTKNWQRKLELTLPKGHLALEAVELALDTYFCHGGAEIDYIHGNDEAWSLATEHDNTLAILLPEMDKNEFFNHITHVGNFPRKTFSIGEAREKRYYLESRLLTPVYEKI